MQIGFTVAIPECGCDDRHLSPSSQEDELCAVSLLLQASSHRNILVVVLLTIGALSSLSDNEVVAEALLHSGWSRDIHVAIAEVS